MNAGTCAHFWRGSCGESGVLQKIAVFSKYKMIIVNHSMCWSSVHMCSRTGPVIWPTQLIFILYFYIAGQSAGACCMLQPCVFNFVRTTLQKIIFSTFFFRKQPQRPTCAQKLVPRVVAIHVYSMTAPHVHRQEWHIQIGHDIRPGAEVENTLRQKDPPIDGSAWKHYSDKKGTKSWIFIKR